jgi:DNA-binding NtrC family response regulator
MLAPPPEVMSGKSARCRRHAPNHRTGPPWWDITFVPLPGSEEAFGIVGFIEVSGEGSPAAARKVNANVMAIRESHFERFTIDAVAGGSLAARRLASQMRLAAGTTSPVWLVGDAGSGKEAAARAIHRASPNRDRAFLALDCHGLQPYLIESLLWGHGGLAGSDRVGAVYLKEPAAMPRDLQQRFLDHFADVARFPRILCGSTRAAIADVNAKSLLPEFHTRLAALEVRLPSLRERLDDLPRFTAAMLGERRIEPAATAVLAAHSWPGNLRELRTVLQESVAAAGEAAIQREHVPRRLRERLGFSKPTAESAVSLDATLEEVERKLIQAALRKAEGNVTQAAVKLGVQRNRLIRRIETLGITVPTPT